MFRHSTYVATAELATERFLLPEILRNLHSHLSLNAPVIAAALRPGLDKQDLQTLLARLPHPAPEAVEVLYQWHDGSDFVEGGPYRAELFPGGQMLPLKDSLHRRTDALKGDRRQGTELWDARWLPVFTDGRSGCCVVVCGTEAAPVLSFDFVDLPQTVQEYADLEAMMGSILRRWSSGAYQEGELASVDKDGRALAAIYRTEDAYGTQDLVSLIRDLDEGSELAYGRAIFLMRTRLYPDAVPSLARLLLEGSRRGRVSAAELLGAIGDVAAIPALRRSAERDPDDGIRAYSQRSLRKLDIMESRP